MQRCAGLVVERQTRFAGSSHCRSTTSTVLLHRADTTRRPLPPGSARQRCAYVSTRDGGGTLKVRMPGYNDIELVTLPDRGFWAYVVAVVHLGRKQAEAGTLHPDTHTAMRRILRHLRLH